MDEIQSIPTTYKGVRYRSRLEARTAIFFDTLGVRHEYEKQKYDLGDFRYIPDFWLPDLEMFVEMKGQLPTEHEKEKARRLALQEKYPVMIVSGVPYAVERELGEYIDSFGDHYEVYDHTGEPEYACMLFARMAETEQRIADKFMPLDEYIRFKSAPSKILREYDVEMTNITWAFCQECERLCVTEHITDDGRDYYRPLMGCSSPNKHVFEIELLDYWMKLAYEQARQAHF